jgi:Family of unknown function (DUF6069)
VAASPSARDGNDAGEELRVNANRLWTGGIATAVVAALVAVVGVLIARGLFDVPVLAPTEDGVLGNASTARLALVAAGAALAATGLMHLLLLSIPRPWQFFTWIMSLATLAAVLAPFSTGAAIATKGGHGGDQPRHRGRHRVAGVRGRDQRRPPRQASPAAGLMMLGGPHMSPLLIATIALVPASILAILALGSYLEDWLARRR